MGCDVGIEKALRTLVAGLGKCRLETVSTGKRVVHRLTQDDVGMLVAHVADAAGEGDALECLEIASRQHPSVPVVVLSESDDPAVRLRFLQADAVDCLPRPISFSRLVLLMDVTTARRHYLSPNSTAEHAASFETVGQSIDGFLCATPGMANLLKQVRTVALSDSTILLTGETGTGKTSLARRIHRWSPRKDKPIVVVQCGAIPQTLVESELFGHVRGAFTSADRDQTGKFAEAQEGTLLLDEIDCLPFEAQGKLLAAVEDRVFEPVGSAKRQPLRARLIVAANRALQGEMAAGRFRSDLFYRLHVVDFSLPTLRDQPQAIRPLAQQFLATYCRQTGRRIERFTECALAALEAHDWPGNVRELRNAVERAVALSTAAAIDLDDLPEVVRRCSVGHDGEPSAAGKSELEQARCEAEKSRMVAALDRHQDCRSAAAAELGISRVTLYKKLRRYGLV